MNSDKQLQKLYLFKQFAVALSMPNLNAVHLTYSPPYQESIRPFQREKESCLKGSIYFSTLYLLTPHR